MFDLQTTAMLRLVLDEVCADVGQYENSVRAHVASKLLEAAALPDLTIEDLKLTGREALSRAPTMWRRC
ncbi:hypothetical protein [Bradyrhizobium sp. 199]|uniref:hypothetical protein n=1 Tax=Bradyrhizobium sp. 199 TaxID=2782664 RepID=UPI001FFA7871|nr:hypothetical protein [Bradyrhizobium sp. 199]MCK1358156.1 hypothetical protein [Bradyrhizobium sp. 199]